MLTYIVHKKHIPKQKTEFSAYSDSTHQRNKKCSVNYFIIPLRLATIRQLLISLKHNCGNIYDIGISTLNVTYTSLLNKLHSFSIFSK